MMLHCYTLYYKTNYTLTNLNFKQMKTLEQVKKNYQEMLNTSDFEKGIHKCKFDVYDFGRKMLDYIESEIKENCTYDTEEVFTNFKNYMGYDLLKKKVNDPYHFHQQWEDSQTIGSILTGVFEITYK